MINRAKDRAYRLLRWSERYTKTDMVYLASGGFWLLVGQVGALAFSFLLAVAFGHFASQDLYGNYKYALSLAGILGAFTLSGLGTAITQATAKGKEGALRQGFSLNFKWSIGIPLIGLGAALYYHLSGNQFVSAALIIIALLIPFQNSFALYDTFLVGRRKFRNQALYNIVTNFAVTAFLVTTLFVSKRAIVLVVIYFLINLIFSAYWYFRSVHEARNNEREADLFRYGAHLSVIGAIGTIADKIDSIAVFTFLGPSQLAVYTFAIAMPEQIKGMVKNLIPLSMPKFANRPISEIKEALPKRLALLASLLILGTIVYVLAAPLLFRYLFPLYVGSIWYSQLYATSLVLGFVTPITAVFQSQRRTRELYITSNISSFTLLILLPILTYAFGITGAIVSQIISRAINLIASLTLFLIFK